MNYVEKAKVFKAFCDETRLQVLDLLQDGEVCACVLLEHVQVVQSTLSHHMKILVDSGVVQERKEGKWKHYSLNTQGGTIAQQLLNDVLHKSGDKQ